MRYTDYSYLWPPRPETKLPQSMLGFYQKRGYWAQVKKNGTCTVIFARGLEVLFKTRHLDIDNGDHRMWTPLPEHTRFFQSASPEWNVYVAELIHSKTPHIKNELYIFDQIVENGVHLVGSTFAERQAMLHKRWKPTSETYDQYRIAPYISVAKSFDHGFNEAFTHLNPEDEGLVLKDPNAELRACFKQDSNNKWQAKCRVPTKNYGF